MKILKLKVPLSASKFPSTNLEDRFLCRSYAPTPTYHGHLGHGLLLPLLPFLLLTLPLLLPSEPRVVRLAELRLQHDVADVREDGERGGVGVGDEGVAALTNNPLLLQILFRFLWRLEEKFKVDVKTIIICF